MTLRAATVALVLVLAASQSRESRAAAPERRAGDVHLERLGRIHVPAEPDSAEAEAARVLQEKLETYYNLELDITEGAPGPDIPAILAGRAAIDAGMIAPTELDAVKHDGYVLKGAGNRLALAGYARQGTVYAAWALLRHLGLRLYPWANGADDGAVEVFEPVAREVVPPFEVSRKPFFEHRDLRTHLDRGRWGGTIREYTLGDPSQAANQDLFGRDGRQRKPGYTKYKFDRGDWTDWFHTAAYLIPRDIYYETDPEYFAIHDGQRIPPSRYARSAICTSHPDVVHICIERALEWLDIQRDRRFFCVVSADTRMCQCDTCLKADPLPGQCTDRMLTWVNAIARAAKARHPDKVILTGAYIETVKPPLGVKPESNVVLMYCPWFWDSRATSDVSLASPLNITAMKELMAWCMRFPGQVGAYDYPGACVHGTANRVKLYAKHGMRVIYFNGPRGDLLQWINSQLIWDPFLDIEKLEDEYVRAFYGPAAEPMGEYLRLRREAIEEHAVHGRAIFYRGRALPGAVGSEYVYRARDLLRSATGQVWRRRPNADPKTQARILGGVLEGTQELLRATHPVTGNRYGRMSVNQYRALVAQYVTTSQIYVRICDDLGVKYLARQYRSTFRDTMSAVGIKLPEVEDEELIHKTRAALDQLLAESLPEKLTFAAVPPKPITVRFDGADEAGEWLSDGTQADLISPAEMAAVTTPSGDGLRGVRIDAPLSRLPTIPKGNIEIHAGRFYAERVLDEPMDVTGCQFLDLHLHSSRDAPVTIYVDNVHSDFHLHAGEQIIRIDLRNFGTTEQFDWTKWSTLERLGIDIWPQDNYYPFPETQDTEITLVSMTVSAAWRESPRGKGLWLSQFRSNIPHGVAVPRERYDELMQRQHYKHVGLDYGWKHLHEGFRTFTEHRAVSPIYGIVTSPNAGRVERAAADELQRLLAKVTGVMLPVKPLRPPGGPGLTNAILLGEAAKAAGLVTDMELKYVGAEGFVINAHNGRIAIAGPDAAGTAHGVARYLEDHGVRFYTPGVPQMRALRRGLLHELYTLERPFFAQRPVAGGWQLMAQRPARGGGGDGGDAEAAAELAESIKDAARRGETIPPRSIIEDAKKSTLSRYVAAKLLWDPFTDATQIIREFPKGG